jgi:hypothetical protein
MITPTWNLPIVTLTFDILSITLESSVAICCTFVVFNTREIDRSRTPHMTSLDRLSDVKKSTSQVVPPQMYNTADLLAQLFPLSSLAHWILPARKRSPPPVADRNKEYIEQVYKSTLYKLLGMGAPNGLYSAASSTSQCTTIADVSPILEAYAPME